MKTPFRRMRNRSSRESDCGTVLGGSQVVQPSAVTDDTEDTGGTMVELSMKILFTDVLHQDCQYPQRGSLRKQEVQRGLQGSRSARDGAMGVSSLLRRGWTSPAEPPG